MNNRQIVQNFIQACNDNNLDRILGFFTDESIYHNIPMEPVKGIEGVRQVLGPLAGLCKEVNWVVHAIAESDDGVVLTERTDRFRVGEKWLQIRVMGAFELKDGKITAWRDYYDSRESDAAFAAFMPQQ